jgi:ATP-dependent DNA helicase RecQ
VLFRKDPRPTKAIKKFRKTPLAEYTKWGSGDNLLWEKLRDLRREIAEQQGIPAFVVFHDKTLKEMVALKPATREELLQVNGVGETKADRYGEAFLRAICAVRML